MSFPFAPLDPETAPAAARGMLTASQNQFGFLPSAVAKVAHAPVVLKHLLAGFAAFDQTSLSALDREVIAMTVAFENGCHYCMALHSAMTARDTAAQPIIAALRAGTPLPDAKLEALHVFVTAVIRDRAAVAAPLWTALEVAGYTEAQALEIVLGVGVYVLSTFANIVTRVELDPPFVPFAWQRPELSPPRAR